MKILILICGLLFFFVQTHCVVICAQTRPKTVSQTAKKKTAGEGQTGGDAGSESGSSLLSTPKVAQIDEVALKNLLKREGENAKPLLVNFWATWCDPCREEFPELVKIDAEYKGKIDFIVVSLDDLAEIDRDVPKFLTGMKATMPAYLLKTESEESAISSVSKEWKGGLPFTILFNSRGEAVYNRQGKVKPEILRAELNKILSSANAKQTP